VPSPLVHALAGFAVATRGRRFGLEGRFVPGLLILAANAPDFDFVPGLLVGDMARFHHGPPHSLGAAALIALATGLVARRLGLRQSRRLAILAGLAVVSHLFLDMMTTDEGVRFGLPLFWPISNRLLVLPFSIFVGFRRDFGAATLVQGVFIPHNAYAFLVELAIVALLSVVWLAFTRVATWSEASSAPAIPIDRP
jgi:membrane-bound metal-dependent hydrolase YbcI (DUF457 family)